MGTFNSIDNKQHVEIVALYSQGLGYNKIAEKLERSTRTPYTHVHKHNNAVKRSGFCPMCRRAGGEYENKVVVKKS